MQEDKRNPKTVCSRIGFGMLCMMGLSLAAMQGLIWLCGRFFPAFLLHEYASYILSDAALYLVGAPALLLLLRGLPDGTAPARQPVRVSPARFVLLLLLLFGSAYGINLLGALAEWLVSLISTGWSSPAILDDVLRLPAPKMLGSFWGRALFMAVVPALGEEFLFRHMLARKLRGAGDATFILFSALCFGVFHMNFSQALYAFGGGIIFAWVYTRTGTIWYSVGLHFLFNLKGVVLQELLSRGVSREGLATYLGVMFLVEVLYAIICLVRVPKRESAHMLPPTEPGWPYRTPRALRAAQRKAARFARATQRMAEEDLAAYIAANPDTYYYNGYYLPPPGWPAQPPYIGGLSYPQALKLHQQYERATRPSRGLLRICLLNPGMLCFLGLALGIILYRLLV